jgi:hypothetical protein
MHLMGTEAVWAAPASGPTVTQMSPAQGTVDTLVTITGTGFDANAANDVVQFTGLDKKSAPTGTIVSAGVTQLVVAVPSAVDTGPVTVTVNGQSVKAGTFTVILAINAVSPATGGPGTPVTITGTQFNTSKTGNQVAFNGAPAAAATTGPITVTVPGAATASSRWACLRLGDANPIEFSRVYDNLQCRESELGAVLPGAVWS